MTANLEKYHKYLEETIDLKKTVEGGYLALAERLSKIHSEEMYLPEYESWHQFLDEMDLSEATASKLINIWNRFVIEYGVPKRTLLAAGGWSHAAEILPYAKDKATAEKLLDKITGLMPGDKRRMIRELRTGIDPERCRHDWYTVRICSKCQSREKIYEQS